ncbi:PqiB family protein [Vibrio sonorensis]|uniref:PqiB family protein n=1 Tax=Vibrio sonorensis TaxID=1004316 RepID=UPI0008DA020D|nr:MlaD family protein [Vibrio sonorensis]
MSDHQQPTYSPEIKRNRGVSPLWMLPVLTMVLAGWLVFKAIQDAGDRIQIYFSNAQGLIVGRTPIKYQGLEVGMVKGVNLSENLEDIYVDADIYPEATKLLSEGTRFWLVKPTASLTGISGLDALVTGNYIAILPSDNPQGPESVFRALDGPPSDILAKEGLNISLKSADLGGISIGSQIVYKKIPIGEVYAYKLAEDDQSVEIQASIKEEFKHIITSQSRFWNVSGIGASIGFEGVDVRLDSLTALVGGSIAVDSPDSGEPVADNMTFRLYPDLKTAGRGIAVKIALPDGSNINPNGAPIVYRGIPIGQITDLDFSEGREQIIASAAIEPAFSDMLNVGSQFVLEEAQLSLTGVENLTNLVKGNFLTIEPGEGEKTRYFMAMKKDQFKREKSRSLPVRLTADHSYGLSSGTKILYKGIKVGTVTDVKLDNGKVTFDTLIDLKYTGLIRSDNRFFVSGTATADITESGLSIYVPPAKELLTGSISFVSQGSKKTAKNYKLYQNQSLAELAEYKLTGSTSITLFSETLPSLSAGSPVLYRNLEVGRVDDFTLVDGGVLIKADIEKQYAHLLTDSTVFWNRSGVEVNADLSGIEVKAAPIKTLINGGIAFDNLQGVDNKSDSHWLLYSDYKTARKSGTKILLTQSGETSISKGTPIQYNGVKVGEVTQVVPDFDNDSVKAFAHVAPEYADIITRAQSHFWLPQAEVSLKGVRNLKNLVSQSINVTPGEGKQTTTFALHSRPQTLPGVKFILQSEARNSVSVGTPLLFRDLDVGEVIDVQLGDFADRVTFTVSVNRDYAYLVRENSVFWNSSGVDVSIGLTGANVKAGTVDSLIRGGISFATPEQANLTPQAPSLHSFYLHPAPQDGWREWRTAIPKP